MASGKLLGCILCPCQPLGPLFPFSGKLKHISLIFKLVRLLSPRRCNTPGLSTEQHPVVHIFHDVLEGHFLALIVAMLVKFCGFMQGR